MKISLCLICKNEERTIARCIQSVKEVVDEIIVVDTGSTDATMEIAKKEGAKLYQTIWENDFSKARNYALDKATGEWIIFLDADEYVGEGTAQYIRPTLEQCKEKNDVAVLVNLVNLGNAGVINTTTTVRIFARKKYLIYEGAVHERIVNTSSRHKMRLMKADNLINVFHTGYMSEVIISKDKINRNKNILLKELDKDKREPWSYGKSDIYYYLMQCYQGLKDFEAVVQCGKKALEYKDFGLIGIMQKVYGELLNKAIQMKKGQAEIEKWYQEAIECDDAYPDFDWYYSYHLIEENQVELGIKYLEKCIEKTERYNGLANPDALIKIKELYEVLINQYIKIGDIQNALVKIVKLLKVDKYDYAALKMMLILLDDKEETETVIKFLTNIYDYHEPKDRFVLTKLSSELINQDLYTYFSSLLTDEERKILNKENKSGAK